MKNLVLSVVLATISLNSSASLVAVMDSGTDTSHVSLRKKAWVNSKESVGSVDRDGDGLAGNKYGWDFTTNTAKFFDSKYASLYTKDVRKFFAVLAKNDLGTISSEEVVWIKTLAKDKKFMALVDFMGVYNHGTNVAGIAAQGSDLVKIMPLKLISAEPSKESLKALPKAVITEFAAPVEGSNKSVLNYTVENFREELKKEARDSVLDLAIKAAHLKHHGVDVANQSYGLGFKNVLMLVAYAYTSIFKEEITKQLLIDLTVDYLQTVEEASSAIAKVNSKTLFVVAAGNDSLNNDMFGAFPTNVRIENKISVAASNGYKSLAKFSNYGANKVDVAAPGVAIESAAVGQDTVFMSGTSQATPFVSNVAARAKDINPRLSAVDLKKLIMGTVDKKAWLVGKVKSSGVVNLERALKAAELSRNMSLSDALVKARAYVKDVAVASNLKSFDLEDGSVDLGIKFDFSPKLMPINPIFQQE